MLRRTSRLGRLMLGVVAWVVFACSANPGDVTLTIRFEGTGSGRITWDGAASGTCPSADASCAVSMPRRSTLTFRAEPSDASLFEGWGGACIGGAGECVVDFDRDRELVARFMPGPEGPSVRVRFVGSGAGQVARKGGPESCSSDCRIPAVEGESITLVATPDPSALFTQWGASGACDSVIEPECTVVVAGASVDVEVDFAARPRHAVTIAVEGPGRVTSADGRVECTGSCVTEYYQGDTIRLTALPDEAHVLASWSGRCATDNPTCDFVVMNPSSVGAHFAPGSTVTITKSGAGSGRVRTDDGKLDCGGVCSALLAQGATIRLRASPDAESAFRGYSGPCTGERPCQFNLDGDSLVDAAFVPAHLWSMGVGSPTGTSWAQTFGVAVDSTGNLIVVGSFGGVVDFGGGAMTSTGYPTVSLFGDLFISKYTSAGVHLWSKQFGDAEQQWAMDVAVDANDNIYVVGWALGTIDFGGGPLSYTVGPWTPSNTAGLVLAKFTPSGAFAAQLQGQGSYGASTYHHLAISAKGEVALSGRVSGQMSLDGTSVANHFAEHGYVAMLDTSLHLSWARSFPDSIGGAPLHFTSSGNIVVSLTPRTTSADYGCGPLSIPGQPNSPSEGASGVVVSYTASGQCRWSKVLLDPTTPQGLAGGLAYAGADGDVFVAIQYAFDPVSVAGTLLSLYGPNDIMEIAVARLDESTGNVLWVRSTRGSGIDNVRALTVDRWGAVVLSIEMGSSQVFEIDGVTHYRSGGFAADALLVRFDPKDGVHLSSRKYAGASEGAIYDLLPDSEASVLVRGWHKGGTGFQVGGSPLPAPWFLARLNP